MWDDGLLSQSTCVTPARCTDQYAICPACQQPGLVKLAGSTYKKIVCMFTLTVYL